VEDANIYNGNVLADKVEINLNMLDTLMLDDIGGEIDYANIGSIVDQGASRHGIVQLQKQFTEPSRLHAIGHNIALRLST
jgi:hypothetical protein